MTQAPFPPLGDAAHPVAQAELTESLLGLGLSLSMPVLVLVGGAANLDPAVERPLRLAFDALVPVLDWLGAALIDGGTAFGVMRLIGESRRCLGGCFPLIGVAAAGTVDASSLPDGVCVQRIRGLKDVEGLDSGARLDPHHSHLLLVPGDRWGDESPWIDAAAATLAGERPTLTLVAAGGRITALDAAVALRAGRSLVVLAGTGGTADRIADAWRERRDIRDMPDLPFGPGERARVRVLDLSEAPARLSGLVRGVLGS